jgi:hypothetical protein
VAEFEWWRERELELARAQGDDALHLPSPTPYRKRWETWEGALLHFGYTADEIAERLEQRATPRVAFRQGFRQTLLGGSSETASETRHGVALSPSAPS